MTENIVLAFFEKCHLYVGPYENIGRIACSAIMIPLILEYIFDQSITWLSSNLREVLTLEDPFDHGIVLSSLLFTSHLPILLLGETACFAKDLLLPLSQFLLMVGVLGKLHSFASNIWKEEGCLLVLTFYFSIQTMVVVGMESNPQKATSLQPVSLQLIALMRGIGLVFFLIISKHFPLLYSNNENDLHHFFVTKRYLCSILCGGLLVYQFGLMCCSYWAWSGRYDFNRIVGNMLTLHFMSIIIISVLPARVVRRMITAVEHSDAIQREIDQKNTFVRYISHEIRFPLSTTSLGIDCLYNMASQAIKSQEVLQPEEAIELIRDYRITCTVALHTLNDLLLFDKIENNMLHLKKKEILCGEFLEESIRPFTRQLQLAGMHFSVNIDGRLACCSMTADRLKLEQVVRNLISNAAKFTPLEGSIVVNASLISVEIAGLGSQEYRGRLRFEVNDTDPFSKENQVKLFQQYVQVQANVLQAGKGSGLGLWISKAIVEMHEGIIGVSSRGEGYGYTFFFEIPVRHNPPPTSPVRALRSLSIPDRKAEEPVLIDAFITVSDETPQRERLQSAAFEAGNIIIGQDRYNKSLRTVLIAKEEKASTSFFSLGASPNKEIPRPPPLNIKSDISLRVTDLATGINLPFSLQTYGEIDNTRRIKVMIADDSILTRKMVERVLAPYDMIIHHSNKGADVVEKVLESMKIASPPATPNLSQNPALSSSEAAKSLPLSSERMRMASNEKEVSSLPSCTPYDVVIIDYLMPGLNGAEAIGAMRAACYDGFICAVTGSTSPEDREKLYQSGASIIMAKPFDVKGFESHLKDKQRNFLPNRVKGSPD